MKISIIGYGKMGQLVEKIALKKGYEILFIANESNWDSSDIQGSDVAIEFSTPECAVKNINYCFDAGVPVVVGTTGWHSDLNLVLAQCKSRNGTLLYSTNFSLGVNIFFEINKKLASLMSKHPDYKVSIHETHHTQKLDEPSGTAITIADQIISNHDSYNQWNLAQEFDSQVQDSIAIQAIRNKDVKGTHTISFQNNIDEITITHNAKTREGFAHGALLAAEFIKDKKGVFSMQDVLAIQ